MNNKSIGIGLAGLGTVGSGVVLNLQKNQSLIASRTGECVHFHLARVLVRDISKARDAVVPDEILTTDWRTLVEDPEVQMVVELIGGTEAARELVVAALRAGKPVVTGNKALLAEHGRELYALSKSQGAAIHFEAAVAGGIPIVAAMRDALIGNRIHSIVGIINGTSNYILERMATVGMNYEEALGEAQRKGFAEADPALDVNGWDAGHKAILLAALAYGFTVDPADVHVAGIEQVRPTDIAFAQRLGYVVKLLAVIRERDHGAVEIRVQPSFIPQSHILASVHGVFNAVAVHGDTAGETLFYGRGAGQDPTASAVVSDLVAAARGILSGVPHGGFVPHVDDGQLMPIEETSTAYYVRFDVNDRPGVIAEIAAVLAAHGVGISGIHSPVNPESPDEDLVDMVFLLHSCSFGQLSETLAEIEQLDCVNRAPVVFRIETL